MGSYRRKRDSGSEGGGGLRTQIHTKRFEEKRRSIYVKKTSKEIEVKTQVYIPKDLYEKVSSLAPKVYGIYRGALSRAVVEGLELWLFYRVKQTPSGVVIHTNPRLPLRDRYNAVLQCIDLEFAGIPITVPQKAMERCIMETFNIKDYRSIYGWLHRFYLAGLIKPLTIPKIEKPSQWKNNKSIEIVAKKL